MKPHWSYTLSVLCGILPMFTGSLILATYAVTRWDWLLLAGILCIYGGLLSVFIGVIALIYSAFVSHETGTVRPWRVWGSTWLPVLLFVANFPLAAFCANTGMSLATEYRVQIRNHFHGTIESARAHGGGCDETLGSIPQGESRTRTLHFGADGSLQFSAIIDGRERSEEVESYVTGSWSGDKVIEIEPDGDIRVFDRW